MLKTLTLAALALALAQTPATQTAPADEGLTLEQVQEKIIKAMARHQSVRYTVKTTQDLDTPQMKVKSSGVADIDYQRDGDAWKARLEAHYDTITTPATGEPKHEKSRIVQVYDGQAIYTFTDNSQGRRAEKSAPDARNISPLDMKKVFEFMDQSQRLNYMGTERIDGREVYVIESAPRRQELSPIIGWTLNFYDTRTGLSIKSESYSKTGQLISTSEASNIRIDEAIPAERFRFEAPEGVEVIDRTQPATAPATRRAPDTAPATAPAAK